MRLAADLYDLPVIPAMEPEVRLHRDHGVDEEPNRRAPAERVEIGPAVVGRQRMALADHQAIHPVGRDGVIRNRFPETVSGIAINLSPFEHSATGTPGGVRVFVRVWCLGRQARGPRGQAYRTGAGGRPRTNRGLGVPIPVTGS
ncbi:hypothetical protein GCM10009839_52310 [Catenulispora yoronensis]|uniref:Uncharacterized protein n=1 Tax=Catenulispora yoronensis TaxID=450799 RepID=A0ABP5GBY1_9ACTN